MTTLTTAVPTGTYSVDPAHSNVEFAVKHLGIATVKGTFASFEGTLELGETLADSVAYGTVDVASIDTKESARDEHLRSADFFDAARNPQLTFRSTEIRPIDDIRSTAEYRRAVCGPLLARTIRSALKAA